MQKNISLDAPPRTATPPGGRQRPRRSGTRLSCLAAGLGALLLAPPAFSFGGYLNTWSSINANYGSSLSDDNANCALCHNSFTSGDGFNPYGNDLLLQSGSIAERIQAVEGLDSDGEGSTNLEEIIADAQPGWTGTAPGGVTGDLDPVITEPNIAVAPTALSFSTVTVGSPSTLTTTVENTGTADLNVSGISLGTGSSTDFSVSPTAAFTLAPGATQTVTVTYQPTDIGADTGTVEIASDDPDTPTVVVDLSGTGVAPAAPDIALVPGGVDFGTVTLGETGTQTAQIQNTGDAALLIDSITLCAGTSGEFTWDALASLTIPAGGSETLTVNYTPSDEGTDSGCLSIASNDPDENPIEFTVAGSGTAAAVPDIALDPATLDFGPLTVGASSTLTALIRNAGSADLTVTGVALETGTSSDFVLTPFSTPVTIGPGGSASVEVTYTPADAGTDTGAVLVSSDDPDESQVSIALSGSGNEAPLPPDINLDPTALDFGMVTIGNAESLTAAVHNLGGEPLEVTAVDLCSGTSSEFGWSPSSFTVPAGSSVDLTVSYTPTDEGLDEGCLAIASNDPDEATVELGVSGTGQQPRGDQEVLIKVPGAINPDNEGVTPVKFYAMDRDVIVDKVRCGHEDEMPKRINYEDFNEDGYQDSVALFETDDLEIECGDMTLQCSGKLEDGTDFTGTSSVFKTVGPECRKDDDDDDDDDKDEEEEDGRDDDEDEDGENGEAEDDSDRNGGVDRGRTGFGTDATPFTDSTESGGAGSMGLTLPAALVLLFAGRLLRRRRS